MTKTKMTKGESIDVLEKQMKMSLEQMANLQGFCQHLQNGIQVVMQSIDGQKMMLNSLIELVQELVVEKLAVDKEEFKTKLEGKFQEQLDKYRQELEAVLAKQQAEMAEQGIESEPLDEEVSTEEDSPEPAPVLSNLLKFPG